MYVYTFIPVRVWSCNVYYVHSMGDMCTLITCHAQKHSFVNTFIDDLFAFIIKVTTQQNTQSRKKHKTQNTKHKNACRAVRFTIQYRRTYGPIHTRTHTHTHIYIYTIYSPPHHQQHQNNPQQMPTMHRLSCFRDDVVFLIYLYQRCVRVYTHMCIICRGSIHRSTHMRKIHHTHIHVHHTHTHTRTQNTRHQPQHPQLTAGSTLWTPAGKWTPKTAGVVKSTNAQKSVMLV
jgi:hypothetical protein